MSVTRLESDGSAIVSKLALARISEDLMTDPVAREQFIDDPIAWVKTTYRVDPSPSDRDFLQGYHQLMAEGNCCGGCKCPPPTEALRTQMTSRASRAYRSGESGVMSVARLDPAGSAIVSKLALARISEDLMTDPVAREQFIDDPIGWVQKTYRVDPSPSDREFLHGYQQLMADGSCCTGCDCPPPNEKLRNR